MRIVVALALVSLGCGGSTDGDGRQPAGGDPFPRSHTPGPFTLDPPDPPTPPAVKCPVEIPDAGSSCDATMACSLLQYDEECGFGLANLTCAGGVWSIEPPAVCQPAVCNPVGEWQLVFEEVSDFCGFQSPDTSASVTLGANDTVQIVWMDQDGTISEDGCSLHSSYYESYDYESEWGSESWSLDLVIDGDTASGTAKFVGDGLSNGSCELAVTATRAP